MTDTGYDGYYEITDQTGTSESNYECSCGVLVWDILAHQEHHRRNGELCKVERQA